MSLNTELRSYSENWFSFASGLIENLLLWTILASLVGLYISIRLIIYIKNNNGFYRRNVIWRLAASIHFFYIPTLLIAGGGFIGAVICVQVYFHNHGSAYLSHTIAPTLVELRVLMASQSNDNSSNKLDNFVAHTVNKMHYQPKTTLEWQETKLLELFESYFHTKLISYLSKAIANYSVIQSNSPMQNPNIFNPELVKRMDLAVVSSAIEKNLRDEINEKLGQIESMVYLYTLIFFIAGVGLALFELLFGYLLNRPQEA